MLNLSTQPPAKAPSPPKEEPTVLFKFAYRFLLADLALRWAILGLYQIDWIAGWIFWVLQIVVIPGVIFYLADDRTTAVARQHNVSTTKTQPKDSTASVLLVVLATLLGTYISYSLFNTRLWLRIVLTVATFFAYLIYAGTIYMESIDWERADEVTATDIADEIPEQSWRDENDRTIIGLETDKISVSHKVEAYTLESALFGALAFSGFVTIIASEKPVLQGVQTLTADMFTLINMTLKFDFSGVSQVFNDLTIENTLLAAIATQTLISAIFFLSVIISRLRFNYVMRWVEMSTRLAIFYNEKEEEVSLMSFQSLDAAKLDLQQQRLEELKVKISDATSNAEESMKHLVPVVRYMSAFRNLGVMSFLLILITSALWVSRMLAVFFTALSIMAFIYPFLDRAIRDRKLARIRLFQRGKRLLPHIGRK